MELNTACAHRRIEKKYGNMRSQDLWACIDCDLEFVPQKPRHAVRLLVEVVSAKDETHGIGSYGAHGFSLVLRADNQVEYPNASMSIQELPPLPSLKELARVFWRAHADADPEDAIRAVLDACGLLPEGRPQKPDAQEDGVVVKASKP